MQTSKITQKGQATIPAKVRKKLNLQTGDRIAFEINQDVVTIHKINAFDFEYHQQLSNTLSEWNCPEDNEAYDAL